MSERITTSGSGETPAADQAKTEAMPAGERQAAPPSGNLGSADPQAPTAIVQSAVDGGPPRPQTQRRGAPAAPREGSSQE
jgi:hypothetical protein